MILLSARSQHFAGTPSFGADKTNKNEQVQKALGQFRQSSVEVLSATPFRSYASQVQKPALSQRLHNIYSLEKD